ncbi:MAG: Ig-like domain-containing protein, partial [Magnetococcales bacterium]|nr:Ig-like domain-containing protein [Magnetococcales bacterium]
TQTNSSGFTSAASDPLFLTVDTTAPAALGVALTSDSGISSTDKISNNGAVTVSGQESGTTLYYSSDGSNWSSSWSAVAGSNSVYVRQIDVAGNVSTTASLTFTLDSTAPATPTIALVSDGGISATDRITNNGAVTVTGTESGTTLYYSSDGNNWSSSFSAVAGSNSVYVRQIDVAGNISGTSAVLAFTLDSTAPTLSSSSPADNATAVAVSTNVVLTFNETVGAGSGSISISNGSDSRSIAIGDSSQVSISGNTVTINPTTDLTANSSYFVLIPAGVLRDTAGNSYAGISDAVTLNFTTLDNTSPVPTNLDLAATDDSGLSSSDNITYQSSGLTISGNGTSGSTLKLYDGSTLLATTVVTSSAWSVDVSLSSGTHTITATQSNSFGITSAASSALMVTVDTTAPATPTVALTSDSGISSSDRITNNGAVTVTGSESGATLQYSSDGNNWNSSWSAVAGSNSVYVRQTDVAGHVSSTSAALVFTLDTSAPVLSSSTPADNATAVDVGAHVVLTFNEPVGAGSGSLSISNGSDSRSIAVSNGSQLSISGNTVTINPTADLIGNSSYFVLIPAGALKDTAGNSYAGISDVTTLNFTVLDNTPPAIPTNLDLAAADDSGAFDDDNLTNQSSGLTMRGNGTSGTILKLFDGSTLLTTTLVANGVWNVDVALSTGSHTITAIQSSSAGVNSASSTALMLTVDTTAPSVPSVALTSDTGSSATDRITHNGAITVTGIETDAAVVYSSDGSNWSSTFQAVSGPNSVQVRQTDLAGNVSRASTALVFTLDTAAPAAPAGLDLDARDDSGSSNSDHLTSQTSNLTISGSGGEVGASLVLFRDVDSDGRVDSGEELATVAISSSSWSQDINLLGGTHAIKATQVDQAGNSSTASTALMITINNAPPSPPTGLDLAAVDDTGLSNSDNVTSQTSALTLSGSGDNGATLLLFDDRNGNNGIDTGEALATATVSGGSWTTDVAMTVGSHSIKAIQTTVSGHSSPASSPLLLTLDISKPTGSITEPVDQSVVKQLLSLAGTAADTGSGVAQVEVQILDQISGKYMVRKNGTWSSRGTTNDWTSVDTDNLADWQSWYLDTGNIWTTNDSYLITARVQDLAGNSTTSTVNFGYGSQLSTRINLTKPVYVVNPNAAMTLDGQLVVEGQSNWNFSGQKVQLTIAHANGQTVFTKSTDTNANGTFSFVNLPGLSQAGGYSLKVSYSSSAPLVVQSTDSYADIRVGSPAGYVVLVQGELLVNGVAEGLLAHKRSTNRIYQTLLNRGFTADNILYFNYDTNGMSQIAGDYLNRADVAANPPTRAGLQQAIETWAADKMLDSAAPLYLIFVDHGGQENLSIGQETVTSTDLNDWLDGLDNRLQQAGTAGLQAQSQKKIILLGACFSGSFIDNLSDATSNRVIITSATAKEKSFRGATETDGVQDGELFLQHLFRALGQGYSLYAAFNQATWLTEKNPLVASQKQNSASNSFYDKAHSKIKDSSGQHPLLDDNGDGMGSNELAVPRGQDGSVAQSLYLGFTLSSKSNSIANQVQIAAVAPTQFQVGHATLLWVQENSTTQQASEAWVTILAPNPTMLNSGSNAQISNDLPIVRMSYNGTNRRWELDTSQIANFSFSTAGCYQFQYALRDAESGELANPVIGYVYKGKEGNHTPEVATALQTLSTSGASEQISQIGLFDWDDVVDSDHDAVTYNLVIANQQDFGDGQIVYRQQALELSQCLVDFVDLKAVMPAGDYYWRVETVDYYGASSTSATAQFTLSFPNDIPAILEGFIYSNDDYNEISGATVKLNGQIISSSAVNGSLQALIPANGGTLTIEKTGYQTKSLELDQLGSGAVSQQLIGLDSNLSAPGTPMLATEDDSGYQTSGLTVSGSGTTGARVIVFDDRNTNGILDNDEALVTTLVTNGVWTADVTLATDGTHTVRALQSNATGTVVSTASAPLLITIDTSVPSIPMTLDLAAADDTGISSSDHITSQTSGLTISGSGGVAGNTLVLFDDKDNDGVVDSGEALVTTNITAASWSTDVSLSMGTHSIKAVQKGHNGSRSAASSALMITITTIPLVATPTGLDLAAADDSGRSNSDNITKATKALTLSGVGQKGATVTLFDEELSLGTVAITAATGKWSRDIALSAGTHTIRASQKTSSGSSDRSSALMITVDSAAPTAPSAPDLVDEDDNGADNRNNITSVTKGLNFSGSGEAGAMVTLFVDKNRNRKQDSSEKASATVVVGSDGQWRSADLALAIGSYSLMAFQTDVAGNVSPMSGNLILSIIKASKQAELLYQP